MPEESKVEGRGKEFSNKREERPLDKDMSTVGMVDTCGWAHVGHIGKSGGCMETTVTEHQAMPKIHISTAYSLCLKI